MLDLKKLASKLEEALARETEETLNAWLATKRTDCVDEYVGEGEVLILSDITGVVHAQRNIVSFECHMNSDQNNAGDQNYRFAA